MAYRVVPKIIKRKADKNLMVVAHPDDEALWGGLSLLDGNWYVLCLTGGDNKTRHLEFEEVMRLTKSDYKILDFPDGRKIKFDEKKLDKELEDIIKLKTWGKILTHGSGGEYGHRQHIQVHNAIKKITAKLNLDLHVFDVDGAEMSNTDWLRKAELLKVYKSQVKVCWKKKFRAKKENIKKFKYKK